ncbi:glycosyltransferase [Parafrigoribacterium soli]|uniref:glycosyltransferase n=1 Tax=Parafrigoribacterium soli TaxID=3144663 RepID=UPI0032EC8AE3
MPAISDAEYVLPLRWSDDAGLAELTDYLGRLREWVPVTVVDGSPQPLFDAHALAWSGGVRHLAPEPWPGRNGKVAGVMTGLRHARSERVILADDDVRYTLDGLRRVIDLLERADCVLPQNYFSPLPWHARWDTARSLINRAFAFDYPGTAAVNRSTLLNAGGYDGDVLFENLELMRTLRANGARVLHADDLFVSRRPPSADHFWRQRIRQAYDDFAQPARMTAELALLPLVAWCTAAPARLAALGLVAIGVAEAGRRRGSGREVFPATASLWAPVWILERAVCVWLAVAARLRGGVRYSGARIPAAGSSRRTLAARLASPKRGHNEGVLHG